MDASGFRLEFNATNSFYVQVWGANSLLEPWLPLGIEWSYDETQTWTDPVFPSSNLPRFYRLRKMNLVDDIDGDGMDDLFELSHGLDAINADDASFDLDGDGVSNLQEAQLGTSVAVSDSDFDGIADGDELQFPCLDAQTQEDANSDPDGDSVDSRLELLFGRNPCVADTGIGATSTYYVSVDGNNASDGSIGGPFATIQYGVDVASSNGGGTVIVGPGTYVDIDPNIVGYGTDQVLFIKDGVYVQGYSSQFTLINSVVFFLQADGSALENVTVNSPAQAGLNIWSSENVLLKSVKVDGSDQQNVYVSNSTNIVLDHVELLSSVSHVGLHMIASSEVSLLESTVSGNYLGGIFVVDSSILTMFNSRVTSNRSGGYGGIYGSIDSKIRLFSSIIENNTGPGIEIQFPNNLLYVENSVVTGNDEGIRLTGQGGELHILHSIIAYNNNIGVNNMTGTEEDLLLMNSILWSNTDDLLGVASNQVYSCDISDGTYAGLHGNINQDPLWICGKQ